MSQNDFLEQLRKDREILGRQKLPNGIGGELMHLAELRVTSLGVNGNLAVSVWTKHATAGRLLGAIGTLLMIGVIVVFFWKGWRAGTVSVLLVVLYSIATRKLATGWLRRRLLIDVDEFHQLYCAGQASLRISATGETLVEPANWIPVVNQLCVEHPIR